jgi:hypothetical protein
MADVGRLARERREDFIEGILNGLKKLEIPSSSETHLFKPTYTLMNLCNRRYAYTVRD